MGTPLSRLRTSWEQRSATTRTTETSRPSGQHVSSSSAAKVMSRKSRLQREEAGGREGGVGASSRGRWQPIERRWSSGGAGPGGTPRSTSGKRLLGSTKALQRRTFGGPACAPPSWLWCGTAWGTAFLAAPPAVAAPRAAARPPAAAGGLCLRRRKDRWRGSRCSKAGGDSLSQGSKAGSYVHVVPPASACPPHTCDSAPHRRRGPRGQPAWRAAGCCPGRAGA